MQIYSRFIKRPFDCMLAAAALVVFWPVMLLTAVLVRVKLGKPIIFKQERPGLNGRIFTLYKFRTMTDRRDKNGNLLPDAKRLTKFGKMLRSTSMDELPEIFNILAGHMSIVGPRPLLVRYLPLYSKEQSRRHEVRPGLTGLAQVNGRNAISWQRKFELDVQYVDNITFIGDLKIIIKTLINVLRREAVSSATSVTVEEFTGEPE